MAEGERGKPKAQHFGLLVAFGTGFAILVIAVLISWARAGAAQAATPTGPLPTLSAVTGPLTSGPVPAPVPITAAQPVSAVVAPVVAPVSAVVAPVSAPVSAVVAPVVASVSAVVAPVSPVTTPVTGLVAPAGVAIVPVAAILTRTAAPVVGTVSTLASPVRGIAGPATASTTAPPPLAGRGTPCRLGLGLAARSASTSSAVTTRSVGSPAPRGSIPPVPSAPPAPIAPDSAGAGAGSGASLVAVVSGLVRPHPRLDGRAVLDRSADAPTVEHGSIEVWPG